jgi:cytochrome c
MMMRERKTMLKTILAVTALSLLPLAAVAEGDAAAGEKVFRKCQACHQVGEGAENKVGPALNGILGRAVGSVADFNYSDVFQQMNADGKVWTVEELSAYLEKPRDYAKGTKMSFAGLRKEEERADVIAYLATFSGEGS